MIEFTKVASNIIFFFNQKETEYFLNFFLSTVINVAMWQTTGSASDLFIICGKKKTKN